MQPNGPNAEQIKYWNEVTGAKWVALQDLLDNQLASIGNRAMDALDVGPGQHVLDIGCGCGGTTLELADRVSPGGVVTGIDISAVMLDRARTLASARGISNVQFENADAQTHVFVPASFDRLYSRFGVMFFGDPTTAFRNLRGSLKSNGRLAFACWRNPQENPWMFLPMMAAMQHMTMPAPAAPGSPGPFGFADPDRVRGILSGAGYSDVTIAPYDETMSVAGGADLDHTVDFLLSMGPTGAALREAPPEQKTAVATAVRDAIAPYASEAGVRMPGATWIVTARA